MGLFGYIGLAVLVGLLVGLVTLSVVWTVRTVGKSLRDRSVSLLSSYDRLLEERSRQLSWLDAELQKRQEALEENGKTPPAVQQEGSAPSGNDVLRMTERIAVTGYQNSGSGDLYRKIKENFVITPQEALLHTPILDNPHRSLGGPATRLLRELSFETIFSLSTLPGEEQLSLLRQEIPGEDKPFLEEYAGSVARFDAVAFYDALQSAAAAEPGPIRVWVPKECALPLYPGEVQIAVDEDICEGVQVEADNVLYDYCVKTGEIG